MARTMAALKRRPPFASFGEVMQRDDTKCRAMDPLARRRPVDLLGFGSMLVACAESNGSCAVGGLSAAASLIPTTREPLAPRPVAPLRVAKNP
eukprot:1900880-Prymnesium_polylepis.1